MLHGLCCCGCNCNCNCNGNYLLLLDTCQSLTHSTWAEGITRMCYHKFHCLWSTLIHFWLLLMMTWHLNCQGAKCQDIRSAEPPISIRRVGHWKSSSAHRIWMPRGRKTIWCWLMCPEFWRWEISEKRKLHFARFVCN